MVIKTHTPLISEILDKVHKAKTKDKKVAVLRQNDSDPLRMVIKSSFDPKIMWCLPHGDVPYKPNEVPIGTDHTKLSIESRKLWHFIQGADMRTPQWKKEQMFVQMLEGLHESEARVICYAKDKSLHQVYKGLSHAVVKESFGWNDEYNKNPT
tara:strand:+ start:448 stop:906 length:459 start_codon:yes stop_codon:yes gene_type:complete